MSKNIQQVFVANPITSNTGTDLMYFGQSPYGATNDAAMTFTNFAAQFVTNVSLPLALSKGGTGANLTASNGGIFYSTATTGAILAGTATADQVLLSGISGAPSWSTATYPPTTVINQLLYSNATNTIVGLATANNGTLVTNNTGVPSILVGPGTTGNILQSNAALAPSWSSATYPSTIAANQIIYGTATNTFGTLSSIAHGMLAANNSGTLVWQAMTDGQVFIGSTAGTPTPALLTPGTGITITNASGSITIADNGANPWVDETGSSITMTANTGYTSDDGATLVTFTLPITSAIGDWIEINGKGSGKWKIAQAAGQQINFGSLATTLGATGSLASTLQFDNVRLRCLTANTIWTVVSVQGNLTVV